jgi:hypothetical protein
MLNKNVLDPKLWASIKEEARKKFKVFPSAYASFWITNRYKELGGKYSKGSSNEKTPLKRWKDEIWVNICVKETPKIKVQDENRLVPKKQKFKECGRKTANLDKKDYPLCRPSIRITIKSPKTIYEISEEERVKMCKKKRSMEQGVNGKPVRVFFSK